MSKSPIEVATMAVHAAKDKKAINPVVLDIKPISVICDYFLICSGNSSTQVNAIAENIIDKLKENGVSLSHREGSREAKWVLLDYASLVVHIFEDEERQFYNLERLWGDAKVVDL